MAAPAISASLSALARFLEGDATLAQTLDRVAHLSVDAVEPASLCGITMLVDGRACTTAFTDEAARRIDQAQYDAGGGPCLAAFATGQPVQVLATSEDRRWPEFRRAAADHGINSSYSVPLTVDGSALGSLNLYAEGSRGFDDAAREAAELFGSQAAISLAVAGAYWGTGDDLGYLG
jgi:GAF domain-containing protein